ncbi:MAG: dihydroorotase [candidate division Zixibacteria bacterium]|nr:dihydroorotase [candidate division Zixibacteria bacterium]
MSNKIKLIKNGTLVLPDKNEPIAGDIYLEEGVIKKINLDTDSRRKEKAGGDGVIDAKGLLVFPGLIDMHVHLREPGREDEETIATGTAAAAAGGFTAVACMPNTLPPVDNQESVMFIKQLARDCPARVYPVGAISKGRAGKEISEIGEMVHMGAVAISDDGSPVHDAAIMRRALEYAGMFGIPVISHAEDSTLTGNGVMNEGYESTRLGMPGIPPYSEEVCISRDIILCKHIGTRLHIAHVSTKGSVELVRRAKAEGVRVTAEAMPHHFTLTDTLIGKEFNTNLKMMPPLRTQEDVDAIIAGLMDGTIDAIASDHAPHSSEEKEVEFDQAPNGIIGLETTVGLVATFLVRPGHLTWNDIARKLSNHPARILKISGGELKANKVADITIIDPKASWAVRVDKFASKSRNSPYDGWKLHGKVRYTILGGTVSHAS